MHLEDDRRCNRRAAAVVALSSLQSLSWSHSSCTSIIDNCYANLITVTVVMPAEVVAIDYIS